MDSNYALEGLASGNSSGSLHEDLIEDREEKQPSPHATEDVHNHVFLQVNGVNYKFEYPVNFTVYEAASTLSNQFCFSPVSTFCRAFSCINSLHTSSFNHFDRLNYLHRVGQNP
jgi:hypothetical protein